jgi:hypothetical protein
VREEGDKVQYLFDPAESNGRTTLMIKNIPNKYSQKMLLAVLDRAYAGK